MIVWKGGHNFESSHLKDDCDQVWFQLVKWLQRRRFFKSLRQTTKIGKNYHFRSNNSKTSCKIFLKFIQHIDLVLLIIIIIHIFNLALIVSKIIV